DALGAESCRVLSQMIQGNINTPKTSSMGRLFDAISALLGICTKETYDGQPAIELEAALYRESIEAQEIELEAAVYHESLKTQENVQEGAYHFEIEGMDSQDNDPSDYMLPQLQTNSHPPSLQLQKQQQKSPSILPRIVNPAPVVHAILDDLASGVPVPAIARRFHDAVCTLIVELAICARQTTGLAAVALSGGVFMNRYLISHVVPQLEQAGFRVLLHRDLPANDGCIAYGQAVVAAARLASGAMNDILDDRQLIQQTPGITQSDKGSKPASLRQSNHD
ncbi:MAG: hypothetical protein FWD43_05400, partial [Coriobacteriia bacterium]|nr:hypothetical protein [Coriobacteriia bacterium]